MEATGNIGTVLPFMDNFPVVDERVVAALVKVFPDRCPDIQTPEKQVWFDAGRADVIRFLAAKLQEQEQNQRGGL